MGLAATPWILERRLLNRSLPLIRRTPRELLCVAVGVALLLGEWLDPNPNVFLVNVLQAGIGTFAFACRFHAARWVCTAMAMGIAASWWLMHDWSLATVGRAPWRAFAPLAVITVLASGDLVQRFDRAKVCWFFRNRWAELSDTDLRLLRWSTYALAMVGSLLMQGYYRLLPLDQLTHAPWRREFLTIGVAVALLVGLGFRPVVLAIPVLCFVAIMQLTPDVPPLPLTAAPPERIVQAIGSAAQPALIIAYVGLALSSVVALRYLRRCL